MITIIDTKSLKSNPIPEGTVENILSPSHDKTMGEVAKYEVAAGKTHHVASSSDRTQVTYIMEGKDAEIALTQGGKASVYPAQRRHGVYLEPNEEATIKASGTPLVLL